ncbi:conserved hypothetical protein [Segniliparus rotundus DSM 44985]|uniref:Uncharacterized protein n=1 Tax=Segniliparus rotundus (strain ATCC BAA-972 / CDC 1076 / CIP 108378 / DSM 44985 / JCM 13578) TaxID=640132 RepID=D6ZE58_SEGRD|nr:conserved hypothetical protein [Segniliparus rotundus DSM 44985]
MRWTVYRVFEALEELGAIVEEARSVPMTSNCVVPRGDVLELIDDIREALPADVDDAQDVLDQRDRLLEEARIYAQNHVEEAHAKSESAVEESRHIAERITSDAAAQADRVVKEAQSTAQRLLAEAQQESERLRHEAQREYESATTRAREESERLLQAGNSAYEHAVNEGLAEQRRLVSQSEVAQAARVEATRVVDAAHAESDRTRAECDFYVDTKLAEFEEFLVTTSRTVARGRQQLRAGAGTHDLVDSLPSGRENRERVEARR